MGSNEMPNYNPIDPNTHFSTGALHRSHLYDQMETGIESNVTYIQARKLNVFTLMNGMNNLTDRVFRTIDIGGSYISTASALCKEKEETCSTANSFISTLAKVIENSVNTLRTTNRFCGMPYFPTSQVIVDRAK